MLPQKDAPAIAEIYVDSARVKATLAMDVTQKIAATNRFFKHRQEGANVATPIRHDAYVGLSSALSKRGSNLGCFVGRIRREKKAARLHVRSKRAHEVTEVIHVVKMSV
jgi:hypothetical protein